ncbi:DUF6916 family protein [Oharaeibacter diazotrophicus]|uniref:DUF6916 domain-containing protein n=1 Tax=Oharaeibacter diazotrophicus TaxID=1920512 RepID=A0A4R6RLB5_9HYPH|nr:hypothetical protein [Oharaeibacter diazotrophicus]TDP87433.1 hypothetical protein EDD54_1328 [Oharaeibacter diazotrophicus]BBE70623.1 hypothetical protein OHA_1_00187 [Pleomorphomonas sp. SM30]GLS77369.1 hypothetical protein GCM10007904_27060 [Oharaeibacter diazotrophicus]
MTDTSETADTTAYPDLDAIRAEVGTRFMVNGEPMTLVSAEPLRAASMPGRATGFALVFAGEPGRPMRPQALRALEPPLAGIAGLFLVCVGPRPGGGFRYEAVFN